MKDHDTVESNGILYNVHSARTCAGPNCTFHNPSDHNMVDWPFMLRMDRHALVERICPHGVGHPDPDSVDFLEEHGPHGARASWSIHGCDGCCQTADVEEAASKRRHPTSRKPKPEPVKPEPDETWYDLVHKVAQEFCEFGTWHLDDEEKDLLLWEHTAFPMASRETVEKQLREEFERLAERQWTQRQEG